MDFLCEEISNRGKVLGRIRRADFPARWKRIFLWRQGYPFRNREKPDLRIIGTGNLYCAARGAFERKSHVGLAGGDPHLPNHHVSELDFCFALNTQGEWPTCPQRRQFDTPVSSRIG